MRQLASFFALAAFLTFGLGTTFVAAGEPAPVEQKDKKDTTGTKMDGEQKDKKETVGGKADGDKKDEQKSMGGK